MKKENNKNFKKNYVVKFLCKKTTLLYKYYFGAIYSKGNFLVFALDKNFGFCFIFYWGILKWVKFILAMNNANKFKINLENFVFIVCIILINSYTITATKKN